MPFGTLLLALALLIVVGLLVAVPLLDKPAPAIEPPAAREQLEAERLAVIRAIRELDFDFKTGKLNDDDYKQLREAEVKRGAEILRALDQHKADAHAIDAAIEAAVARASQQPARRRPPRL
jgi:hypothetical protein